MTSQRERRRTIRIRVDGRLTVHNETSGQPLVLIDLGMGGFSAATRAQLPLNAVSTFRFSTPDQRWSARLAARSVYSKQHRSEEGAVEFHTGFSFEREGSADVQRHVMAMMDHATSMSFS
jgi:hypothetical protein